MRLLVILLFLLPLYAAAQTPKKTGGVGFTVLLDTVSGYVKVQTVRKNFPAARAGIKANDLIVKVNHASVYKIKLDTVISRIKGEVGTMVPIQISRKGKLLDLKVQRAEFLEPTPASLVATKGNSFVHIDNNSWQFLSSYIFIYRLSEANHSSELVFSDVNVESLRKFPQLDTVWKFSLGQDRPIKNKALDYLIFYVNDSSIKDRFVFSGDKLKYEALSLYATLGEDQQKKLARHWKDSIPDVDNYVFTYPVELINAWHFFSSVHKFSLNILPDKKSYSFQPAKKHTNENALLDLVRKSGQANLAGSDPSMDAVFNNMIHSSVNANEDLQRQRGLPDIPDVNKIFKFSLGEVKSTLKQWEDPVGILIYTLSGDHLNVLYLNNKGRSDTAIIRLTKSELTSLEISLKSAIKSKAFTASRGGDVINTGATLNADSLCSAISRLLLPSRFQLEELKHLVICPAYNLSAFPFAMLRIKDSLLIDRMSFSITPSVKEFIINGYNNETAMVDDYYSQYLQMMGRREFKDPVNWEKTLFIGQPSNTGEPARRFSELPGAKQEIEMLSRVVPDSKILSGSQAVKPEILKEMADADLVYFATHGIADANDPLNKSFVLVSGDGPDAYLTAKEIQHNKLKAMLVVLSACQTGLGNSHQGGMIGLSRAFQLAGAKNVLMSLWDISDSKTPELMEYFFDALYKDKIHSFFPYDAFRSAVIKFKKKNPDPEYWAAFSMFGVPY